MKGRIPQKSCRSLLEKAIELEPSYARAHAWRACTLSNLADWEESPDSKIFENAFESIKIST